MSRYQSSKQMSRYIKKIFNDCNVGKLLGIEIVEVKDGMARGKLKLKKEHINVFGIAHGGIIFTLADHVGGVCGNSIGKKSLLVESSIQYFKGATKGETIFAEAQLIHKGKKIGRIDIKITDKQNKLIALMHMVFYITKYEHTSDTSYNI